MKLAPLLATATLLLVAGCGSSTSETPQVLVTESAAPEGPPPGGISVRTVNDLRAAVEEAGYECDDYYMREPGPTGADEFANCNDQITFGVFPDQWTAEEWRSTMNELGSNVLMGDRWGINSQYEVLEDLKTHLGGTLDEENTF